MKNIAVTVIVGFITGLVISGILFDVIKYIGKSFNRVSVSWNISKAEKFYSDGRFSDSVLVYTKVLPKIASDNKLLIAKTKNNLALSIMKKTEEEKNISLSDDNAVNSLDEKDIRKIKYALSLLNQANDLYIQTNNKDLSQQTKENIKLLENFYE